MNDWKIDKSEYLIKDKHLTVRSDTVTLPTGACINNFYILEYPDWVNVIAITRDGKFVMERQYRHGVQKVGIEICAGVVENGETPLAAAKRELLEETGFGGGEWNLFMRSTPNPSSMTNYNYTFLALGVEQLSSQSLESTEDIEVFLAEAHDVLAYLENNDISEGVMQAPLWRYFYEILKY